MVLAVGGHQVNAFDQRSLAASGPGLRVRIGIAAGEPVDQNGDIFGAAVTLASRICTAADPGHVLVSDVVHDLGVGNGFVFDGGSDRTLKGFSRPAVVYSSALQMGRPKQTQLLGRGIYPTTRREQSCDGSKDPGAASKVLHALSAQFHLGVGGPTHHLTTPPLLAKTYLLAA